MWGAILGAGINLVANTIGTAIGNKRKREAEEAYRASIDREVADIDNEINSNYLDRADAQNALRKATDANEEALRQLNTEAIRGGATDEAKVAMASKLNKGTASLVGDLAAIGEQRKDALRQQKRGLRLGQAQHNYAIGSDTTGLDTVMQSISGAANSLGTAWDGRRSLLDQVKDFSKDMTSSTATTPGQKIYGVDDAKAIDILNKKLFA
jgi:hypothetical protein